jgi:2-keto-3-deoxy-L-rhamnonate aldolase RhmA
MDLGPCGLMLPMIESAEQLDRICEIIYLPPRGERRPGGPGNRWLARFSSETFRNEIEDALVIVPQIESPLGLENADALAAHSLTTALGVGPFDLSARLGVCGDMNHPKMIAAHARIREAAEAVGKSAMSVGDGETLLDRGYRFLCIAEPSLLMQATMKQLAAELRCRKR